MKNIKNILYYGVLSGLFIIPFIAFIVPQGMFFPFITGKGFTFRIIIEIVFGLYVLLALYEPKYRPKDSFITRSILAFVVVIFVADIFSENPYKSFWSNYERMEGFVMIAHLFLYYIVSSSVFNRDLWMNYLNVSIFSSFLMSLYGLMQIFGMITINQGGVRVDATFGNATYLAIYLVFNIFFCIYMLANKPKYSWLKYSYTAVFLIEIIILYFTATRGAILGLIGGLFLSGLFVLWRERENKLYRKISYGILGGIIIFVGLFVSIRQSDFVKSSPVLSRFSTLSFSEIKNQGRYYVWPMAIEGIKQRPILGWGQESFNYVFNKNYNPQMFGQEEWFDRTHDVVLDWFIAGGLLGFIFYFSIYVALVFYILRRNSSFSNIEKSILIGLISAYLFHNIFVFDNLISYLLFFTVLGFVHSRSTDNEKAKYIFSDRHFSSGAMNYVVIPLVFLAVVLVVYMVNVPAIKANKTLIKAITPQGDVSKNLELFKKAYSYNSFGSDEITEQLVQIAGGIQGSNTPEPIKKEFIDYALEKIREKVNETPNDARYLVFAGSFLNHLGRYDEALIYLERALVESPEKQSILFETGTSHIGKRDFQKMFALFKKAYELQPNALESIKIYAIGAIYTKNTLVLNELSKVVNLDNIYTDNRFLKAYSDIGDYNMVIKILNKRLESDPKNAQYKLNLASVYATIGQKQIAINLLREIGTDNPEYKAEIDVYIKEVEGR